MADEGERIICVSLVATTIMLLQHDATLAYRAPHCTAHTYVTWPTACGQMLPIFVLAEGFRFTTHFGSR